MCVYAGGRDKKVARGVEKRYEEREKATYIRDDIYNLKFFYVNAAAAATITTATAAANFSLSLSLRVCVSSALLASSRAAENQRDDSS